MKEQRIKEIILILVMLGILSSPKIAFSNEMPVFTIIIKDHQFDPKELVIPVNQKVKVIINNQDPTAEEFESYDLNREKIVTGNKQAILFIGPLKAGVYKYFGEFNQKTAQGVIIAK